MKRIIIWANITIVFMLLLGYAYIYNWYIYDVRIGQYLSLSDDASTAEKKLEYIDKYIASINKYIHRNDARFVFKRERLTCDVQLIVLETLKQRLEETTRMNPESFEYQQAMAQISGQEYGHTLDSINSIIHSCWLRQNLFVVFVLWFGPIIYGLLTSRCINWETVADELL